MLDKLTIEDFKNRVGETFTATAGEGRALNLTLLSVDALEARPDAEREPFSLKFRDEAVEHLPQQTVSMQHAEMGGFELFVVPLGPGPDGMRYEAIFT
jgi:hypothetical protein